MKTRNGHWSDADCKEYPPPVGSDMKNTSVKAKDKSANRFPFVRAVAGYVAILDGMCVLAVYFLRK